MDSAANRSSSGRNVRQKRTHSSSSNLLPDEGASRTRQGDESVTGAMSAVDKSSASSSKQAETNRRLPRSEMEVVSNGSRQAVEVPMLKSASLERKDPSTETLKLLQDDLANMRSTLTCKICTRLLFEPYTTPCGHTYCYSCLDTWFSSTNAKKTCPDCRAPIIHQPVPAYIVKDLVAVFLTRVELCPPSDTLESLQKSKEEEAKIVQKDKDNNDPARGGLFKGCFKPGRGRLRPIRDPTDGVDRCPMCNWEIEDGMCEHCGRDYDDSGSDAFIPGMSFSETMARATDLADWYDTDDGDFDGDDYEPLYDGDRVPTFLRAAGLGPIDLEAAMPGEWRSPPRRSTRRNANRRQRATDATAAIFTHPETVVDVVDVDSDDDEGSLTSGFIDDSSQLSGELTDPERTSREPAARRRRRPARRIIDSEASSVDGDSNPNSDDDEEAPIPSGRRARQNRGASRTTSQIRNSSDSADSDAELSNDHSSVVDDSDAESSEHREGSPTFATSQHAHMEEAFGEDARWTSSDGGESDDDSVTMGWGSSRRSVDRTRISENLTPIADRTFAATHPVPNPIHTSIFRASLGDSQLPSTGPAAMNNNEDEKDDEDNDHDMPPQLPHPSSGRPRASNGPRSTQVNIRARNARNNPTYRSPLSQASARSVDDDLVTASGSGVSDDLTFAAPLTHRSTARSYRCPSRFNIINRSATHSPLSHNVTSTHSHRSPRRDRQSAMPLAQETSSSSSAHNNTSLAGALAAARRSRLNHASSILSQRDPNIPGVQLPAPTRLRPNLIHSQPPRSSSAALAADRRSMIERSGTDHTVGGEPIEDIRAQLLQVRSSLARGEPLSLAMRMRRDASE